MLRLLVQPLCSLLVPPPCALLHPDSLGLGFHPRATLLWRVDNKMTPCRPRVCLPFPGARVSICVWVAADDEAGKVAAVDIRDLGVLRARLAVEVASIAGVGYALPCRRPVGRVEACFVDGCASSCKPGRSVLDRADVTVVAISGADALELWANEVLDNG